MRKDAVAQWRDTTRVADDHYGSQSYCDPRRQNCACSSQQVADRPVPDGRAHMSTCRSVAVAGRRESRIPCGSRNIGIKRCPYHAATSDHPSFPSARPGHRPRAPRGRQYMPSAASSGTDGGRASRRRQRRRYSMTRSARASIAGGSLTPMALAVFALTTNSTDVGNSTGRSPGFAPRRILSTNPAMCA